jgi:PKD repeat protein/photosystem II stability/assembly factor-like uncharacterized protein
MMRILRLAAMLLTCLSTALYAQQFEREGLHSLEHHRTSAWYQEYRSDNANVLLIVELLRTDSSLRSGQRSLEWREVVEWLSRNADRINADGIVEDEPTDAAAVQEFLKGAKGESLQSERTWINVGPFTWDRGAPSATGSMGIGVVRCVDRHPDRPDVIVVGTVSAGVWYSADHGASWVNSTKQTMIRFVNDVVIAPSAPSIVYAATDVGIARSDNGGKTLKMTADDVSYRYPGQERAVDVLTVDPTNANVVVVGGAGTMRRTDDGGRSWVTEQQTFDHAWDMRWHPTDSNIVYALVKRGTWTYFLKSTDGGRSFSDRTSGLPQPTAGATIPRGRLAVSLAAPDAVWILLGGSNKDHGGVYGLYRSTSAGEHFDHVCCGEVDGPEAADKQTNPNLFDYSITGNGIGQLTWDMAFDVSTIDTSFVVAGGIFPYYSMDGGRTWKNYTAIHYDVQDVRVIDSSAWIATDGGVFEELQRGTLVDRSDGICAIEVWGFGQSRTTTNMAIGAYHLPIFIRDDDIYDRNGSVGGWYAWSGADAMHADVHPDHDRWIYAKPWSSVRASREKDRSQPPRSQPLGIDLGYITRTNLAFHPRDASTLYGIDHSMNTVVVSHDNASTWSVLETLPTPARQIVIAESDPSVLVVVLPNDILRSTDAGKSWTSIAPIGHTAQRMVFGNAVIWDDDADHLMVSVVSSTTSTQMLESRDGGATWSDASLGLAGLRLLCLTKQRSSPFLYVGTMLGVYVFDGTSWKRFGYDLAPTPIHFLHIDDVRSVIRAGTDRGLWECRLLDASRTRAFFSYDTDTVICARRSVRFASRSVLIATMSSALQWTFEGGEPSTGTGSVVHVAYPTPGSYDVTLVASNEYGTDTLHLPDAITVLPSQCDGIDDISGGAVSLVADDDLITFPPPAKELQACTFTAWIKRHGPQPAYSCVFSSNSTDGAEPPMALHFFGDDQTLGYHWPGGRWWWRSGLVVPDSEWVHVALIVDGKGATVCVNGRTATDSVTLGAIDLTKSELVVGSYRRWTDRNARIDVDEMRWYDRALSIDEVRRSMHHPADTTDGSLLSVFQCNEENGRSVFDRRSTYDGTVEGSARRIRSMIPFGPGTSFVHHDAAARWTPFTETGVDVDFDTSAEIASMISRIDRAPTVRDDSLNVLPAWWIAHTFDTTALPIGNLRISLTGLVSKDQANGRDYTLLSRLRSADDTASWSTDLRSSMFAPQYDTTTNTVRIWLRPASTLDAQFHLQATGEPVSVREERNARWDLSPLPATDHIVVSGPSVSQRSFIITDMQGRVVRQGTIDGDRWRVDLSMLPSAMYLVQINGHSRLLPILK